MKKKKAIVLALASLVLASCGAVSPAGSSSSSSVSSSSLSPSSSAESSLSESSSSESLVSVFTIGFYDGETLLFAQEVEEGQPIIRPENDPSKEGYAFVDWYADSTLNELFVFGNPATKNTAIFASFRLLHSFEDYNERIIPQYSPLSTEATFTEGDTDIVIPVLATEVGLLSNLPIDAVRLFGAFEGLTVTGVTVDQNHLTVTTEGTVKAGEGYLALSKDATSKGSYLTLTVPVEERRAKIDATSYRFGSDNRDKLDFTITFANLAIAREEGMTSAQYKEKVNSGQAPYFTLDSDRYALELLDLAQDFSSLRFRLSLPGPLDAGIAEELRNKVSIHLAKEAFVSGYDQRLHIDLLTPSTEAKLSLSHDVQNNYRGKFEIRLQNCLVSDEFQSHVESFLSEPNNKNAFFTFPGGIDTTLTSLQVKDVTTVQGEFLASADFIDSRLSILTLNQFQIDENEFYFAKSWVDGAPVALLPQIVLYDISFETSAPGTIKQTADSSYDTVKSTMNWVSNNEDDKLVKIVSIATNLGKIGYGLYSGDFTMAKQSAGELLGIDSLLSPTAQILKAIQGVMDKLADIERRIDSLAQEMSLLQDQLEDLGQLSLYTSFMSANSGWNDFLTNYYTPLKNEISSYSTDYFRYYYDLAVASMPGSEKPNPSVTLYYDTEGELAFPGDDPVISIDGRTINKDATRVIALPELVHALSGIRQNSGHSYIGIEDDIVVDIIAHQNIEENLLADVLLKLRFDAMKSCFPTSGKINAFSNVFENFCNALTANQMGGQSGFTPLDYYTTMLETACNFGFETQADINLCIIKLQATFFNAKSVIQFVSSINPGEVQASRYTALYEAVNKEFTSDRFFHPNRPDLATGSRQNAVYCFATNSYVTVDLNTYALCFESDGAFAGVTKNDIRLANATIDDIDTVSEADIRFMNMKAKMVNRVKNTDYTFEEYFCSLGVIPEDLCGFVSGIILKYDGIVKGRDEMDDLTYPAKFSYNDKHGNEVKREIKTVDEVYDIDADDYRAAKGKMYSFDKEGNTFTGLLAIAANGHKGYSEFYERDFGYFDDAYFFGYDLTEYEVSGQTDAYCCGCYAYYINIYEA